jgi:hypothetical protein
MPSPSNELLFYNRGPDQISKRGALYSQYFHIFIHLLRPNIVANKASDSLESPEPISISCIPIPNLILNAPTRQLIPNCEH